MRTVIVDNYDSFTFNLYQMVAALLPHPPIVIRNDELDWQGFLALQAECVIISPGPGRPDLPSDFGLSAEILRHSTIPTLGVCLGHQGICHVFGGTVTRAPQPMHGRIDQVRHDGSSLFAGIPSPFPVVRYHSLIALEPLPEPLLATAWTPDGLLMALAHPTRPLWGVQFHPESICSEFGEQLLANFLGLARSFHSNSSPCSATPLFPPTAHLAPPAPAAETRELFFRRLPLPFEPAIVYETLYGASEIAVWLDSSRPDATSARFSFMAGGPRQESQLLSYRASSRLLSLENNGRIQTFEADLFEHLNTRLAQVATAPSTLPFEFSGGWIGYAGYELKTICGSPSSNSFAAPDSTFLLVERFVAIDHLSGELYLVFLGQPGNPADAEAWFHSVLDQLSCPKSPRAQAPAEPLVFTAAQPRQTYLDNISKCLNHIRDGETYEVCLTNQFVAPCTSDPLAYYHRLRQSNPAPYSAFFRLPQLAIACSSPERFLKVSSSGRVETKPIKGTIRRGQSPEEDQALRARLAQDPKSRSENLMIVDLLRNDLGRVCQIGSVEVPALMQVESFATVHQLVSTITGQLRPDRSAVDCLRTAFPGGSMTGAPKLRTMQIIDALEPQARGVYSGCLGYLSFNGAADFNIIIRTAVFTPSQVQIGVGGAIIALSSPQEEWEEILLKSRALLQAFGPHTLITEAVPPDALGDLRAQLDSLDLQLLALLGQRFDICRQVALRKAQLAIPVQQPGRVEIVRNRAAAAARQHCYSEAFALDLYQLIVAEACRIEDDLISHPAGPHQSLSGSSQLLPHRSQHLAHSPHAFLESPPIAPHRL